jgi:hypothetical protein
MKPDLLSENQCESRSLNQGPLKDLRYPLTLTMLFAPESPHASEQQSIVLVDQARKSGSDQFLKASFAHPSKKKFKEVTIIPKYQVDHT